MIGGIPMTNSTAGIVSGGRIPADADGLRVAARYFRLGSWSILLAAIGWGAIGLGAGLWAVTSLSTGAWKPGDDSTSLGMVGLVILVVGVGAFTPASWALIAAYFKQREVDLAGAINDSRWQRLANSARWQEERAARGMLPLVGIMVPFWPACLLIWLVRMNQLAGRVGELSADTKLAHLMAELRRGLWVLLAEVAGLPVIIGVLVARDLGERFAPAIGAMVMAMAAYVLAGLFRTARQAAVVLSAQADGEAA